MILLFILVFVFLLIFSRKIPIIKGKLGEYGVSRKLQKLPSDKYIVLNDLYFITKEGYTSQVDHIVVSKYGIFVIETKNYSGWIFGNEKSEKWTQVVFQKKNYFRNPIKQNLSHIYALKEILDDYVDIKYIPIVVFSDRATFKGLCVNSSVIYKGELKNEILIHSNFENIPNELMLQIAKTLEEKNIKDKKLRQEHIQNVRKRILENELKESNLICPRCNSELVKRQGKYGSFYGCSRFPYCKFTSK